MEVQDLLLNKLKEFVDLKIGHIRKLNIGEKRRYFNWRMKMEMSRITLRNILVVLLIGSLAAIGGVHSAKKEPVKVEQKEEIGEQRIASLESP